MAVKLSISNIAWDKGLDGMVYGLMQKYGFGGLEIAPTRIFPDRPYEHLKEAAKWANDLSQKYGFTVPSMQSIWYGRTERVFGSDAERNALIEYTKRAIDFAKIIGCKNLVFGCPRNRRLEAGEDALVAIGFFKELGEYAAEHNTVLAMEANPPIYNTNYINDTASALELIKQVNSEGFLLNLDLGTMIQNAEDISVLYGAAKYINHVHISEPGLAAITERPLHNEVRDFLKSNGYEGYVSIEMGKTENVSLIEKTLAYVRETFGE